MKILFLKYGYNPKYKGGAAEISVNFQLNLVGALDRFFWVLWIVDFVGLCGLFLLWFLNVIKWLVFCHSYGIPLIVNCFLDLVFDFIDMIQVQKGRIEINHTSDD